MSNKSIIRGQSQSTGAEHVTCVSDLASGFMLHTTATLRRGHRPACTVSRFLL